MADPDKPEVIRCSVCDREQAAKPSKKNGLKLPPGWKRHGIPLATYCRDCWQKAFVLRAVTIPVGTVIDGEWPEFFDALKSGWKASTDVANWSVFELARHDTPRTAAQERMAKYTAPYLYPGARQVAPALDPSSVVALLHSVEGRYRKARLKTIWFRSASLPIYRYPVPLPVHNQAWECVEGEGGRPCISIRMGGRRWLLSLATARHRRQLGAWRSILSGAAIQGELSLMGQPVTASDHRPGAEQRAPGGGRRQTTRVMVKLVAWFPRRESRERDATLYCSTASDALWSYRVGTDGEPKHLRAEHLKRWEAQHRRHLRAMSDDLKYEKRWPSNVRRQTNERQSLWVKKYRDRIDAFVHEASEMLAKFADRRGVATVVYDDTNQAYVDRFPWHSLKEKLSYKLNGYAIAFEVVGKTDTAQPVQDQEDGDNANPEID